MVAAPTQTLDIVQSAFATVQTPAGAIAAAICTLVLLSLAGLSWRSVHRHDWIFSGTLLGTLLVDSLFVGLASF
jgi:small-conductance mechanosensitive channel